MRIGLSILLAAVLAGLLAAAPTGASQAPGSPTAADFPVAPPPFEVPEGGSQRVEKNAFGGSDISLLHADGSLFAHRTTDAADRMLATKFFFLDGTSLAFAASYVVARPRPLARYMRPSSWCGFDTQNHNPWRWFMTMNWYWNQGSTPVNLNLTNTLNALRGSRIEWESNVNHCFIADASAMNFTYQGTTGLGYGDNGVNTVGWGNIAGTGCPAGSAACTRTEASGGTITESDTRMDASGTWSNSGAGNAADVQSVMAHETGHSIGFNHVSDSSQVMYTPIFLGDTSNRQLGRGDANANNSKY